MAEKRSAAVRIIIIILLQTHRRSRRTKNKINAFPRNMSFARKSMYTYYYTCERKAAKTSWPPPAPIHRYRVHVVITTRRTIIYFKQCEYCSTLRRNTVFNVSIWWSSNTTRDRSVVFFFDSKISARTAAAPREQLADVPFFRYPTNRCKTNKGWPSFDTTPHDQNETRLSMSHMWRNNHRRTHNLPKLKRHQS